MLDVSSETDVFGACWSGLEEQVSLTSELRAAHTKTGALPTTQNERRRYPRFYFWRRAILEKGGRRSAGYTRDLTKAGIGFLSPVQLFPCDEVGLTIESGQSFRVVIRRCRRLGDDCYECGAEFVLSPVPAQAGGAESTHHCSGAKGAL
jgi:hypothetical protein